MCNLAIFLLRYEIGEGVAKCVEIRNSKEEKVRLKSIFTSSCHGKKTIGGIEATEFENENEF